MYQSSAMPSNDSHKFDAMNLRIGNTAVNSHAQAAIGIFNGPVTFSSTKQGCQCEFHIIIEITNSSVSD